MSLASEQNTIAFKHLNKYVVFRLVSINSLLKSYSDALDNRSLCRKQIGNNESE